MAIFTYSNLLKLGEWCINHPRICIAIILVILVYWCFLRQSYFKKHGIPHELPSPIFGNMMQPTFGTISFVERIKTHYTMDNISRYMGFYDFGNPVILIRSPELVRQITVKFFHHFANHRGCVDSIHDPLYSNNLFSLCNSNWRLARHRLSQAFTPTNIETMFELILNCSKHFTDHIVKETGRRCLTINSKDAFARYTNDVFASCAFGVDIDSVTNPNNEFYAMATKALTFKGFKLFKFIFIQTFPQISKLLRLNITSKDVRSFFAGIIRDTVAMRKMNGTSRPDMIQLMMKTNSNTNSQESELTIEEMISQSFAVFSNGFDSTVSLICFVMHMISVNPVQQEKLQKEVDEVFKQFRDKPTYKVINNMKYLEAVINETLRLYPITPYVERICTKSVALPPSLPGGKSLIVKPGSSVWIPVYGLHTDETYYPLAKTFWPHRFIKNSKDILSSCTYLPFGHGPRMCIGNNFVLLITKVLVYHLIAQCRIKPGENMILPLELSPWSFSMSPKGGFSLELESRWYTKMD